MFTLTPLNLKLNNKESKEALRLAKKYAKGVDAKIEFANACRCLNVFRQTEQQKPDSV